LKSDKIKLGQREVNLPVFFPSISTIKTSLKPIEYIKVLNALSTINSQFLVSAYDIANSSKEDQAEIYRELAYSKQKGMTILMDSGNYESYWKSAQEEWQQKHFHEIVGNLNADFAFSFDNQDPPDDSVEHLKSVTLKLEGDQKASGDTIIVPIIHGDKNNIANLCKELARESGVPMIAVAERRLGGGVLERAQTVSEIRKKLDEIGRFVGLHLLGTGNPISIATYSLMGANTFDGLEWCQTVVDHESSLLLHLSQADLLFHQTEWGNGDHPFSVRVLAHNLIFYSNWMRELRASIKNNEGVSFCREKFPTNYFQVFQEKLGWN